MISLDDPRWEGHFIPIEGKISHLYLDSRGILTVGIGCQVFNVVDLPLLYKSNSMPATTADILAERDAVNRLPRNRVASFYDQACKLYLPEQDIRTLFKERLAATIDGLRKADFPIETMPDNAVLVLGDMEFNLGPGGLVSKFPRFCGFMRQGKWSLAATECDREPAEEFKSRNAWARATLQAILT